MKRAFNCNGNVAVAKEGDVAVGAGAEIIQLQGDQRDNVRAWLLEQEIILNSDADRIVIHGF